MHLVTTLMNKNYIHDELESLTMEMTATEQFRLFCLSMSYVKTGRLTHTIVYFYLFQCRYETWSL